ncbi:MAG: hypothetical protein JETT_3325 [Candidatus Jettenia ecosi]|uniref:Uncharacterized protein n=1 Tax=Candidatus Jettenia ecosi TaxID=2494326 RepID=A0A533Q717_9BACT|nr:MAG: hypothetical protein JETT_3325 [Candidatus Jettenia ecosi]
MGNFLSIIISSLQGEFHDQRLKPRHSVINQIRIFYSRGSGNPEKYWIPGQALNDRRLSSNVVIGEL